MARIVEHRPGYWYGLEAEPHSSEIHEARDILELDWLQLRGLLVEYSPPSGLYQMTTGPSYYPCQGLLLVEEQGTTRRFVVAHVYFDTLEEAKILSGELQELICGLRLVLDFLAFRSEC